MIDEKGGTPIACCRIMPAAFAQRVVQGEATAHNAIPQDLNENGSGDAGRYSRSLGSSASFASPPCGE